jgi:hypothetical protein
VTRCSLVEDVLPTVSIRIFESARRCDLGSPRTVDIQRCVGSRNRLKSSVITRLGCLVEVLLKDT